MTPDTHEDGERALALERAERARLDRLVADLSAQLASAETRLARIGELELELRELGVAHARALADLAAARAERDEQAALAAHHLGLREAMQASASWRVTAPLRTLKSRRPR